MSHFGYSNNPDPIDDPFITCRATVAQVKYIAILCDDLGFNTHGRNAHISELVQRSILHPDMLTKSEASQVISKFKEWKEECLKQLSY